MNFNAFCTALVLQLGRVLHRTKILLAIFFFNLKKAPLLFTSSKYELKRQIPSQLRFFLNVQEQYLNVC